MRNYREEKSSLRVNVTVSLKKEAERLANDIGIPLTTIITIQLRDFVQSRSLTVSSLPRLNKHIEEEIITEVIKYEKDPLLLTVLRNSGDTVRFLRKLR